VSFVLTFWVLFVGVVAGNTSSLAVAVTKGYSVVTTSSCSPLAAAGIVNSLVKDPRPLGVMFKLVDLPSKVSLPPASAGKPWPMIVTVLVERTEEGLTLRPGFIKN
jgi:hypothetical protein